MRPPARSIQDEGHLPCPVCRSVRPRSEWRRVLRYVRSGSGETPATVLRHVPCNEIAYFLVE
jgi:hypothetical protein